MPNIMFWNVNQVNLNKAIASACVFHNIDILIIAEFHGNTFDLVSILNSSSTRLYFELALISCRVKIFTRYQISSLTNKYESAYAVIHNLIPPIGLPMLIVSAHMPSKMHQDEDSQHAVIARLNRQIRSVESLVGHKNTIVVGDLNVNPFEKSLVAHDGFHSVMDKNVARKLERTFMSEKADFFYNPMWSRLGDESIGPPGTFFYNSGYKNFFWNTFDQVLIRPSLLPYYDGNELKVLTEIDGQKLVEDGYIKGGYSDHLPLVFSVDIERIP